MAMDVLGSIAANQIFYVALQDSLGENLCLLFNTRNYNFLHERVSIVYQPGHPQANSMLLGELQPMNHFDLVSPKH